MQNTHKSAALDKFLLTWKESHIIFCQSLCSLVPGSFLESSDISSWSLCMLKDVVKILYFNCHFSTFPLNDLKAISVSDFKSRQGFIFYEDWNRFQGHFKRQSISMMISSDNAIRNQFHSILLRGREEQTNQTDLAWLFSISVKNPPRHWPTVSWIGTGPYGCLGFIFEGLLNQTKHLAGFEQI